MGEFGDKFRKARENKGFSLDDVSNVTKIGSRMLQAIEEEHFDQLPGGVFNKGFIRAYAKHLGLNHEEAVTEYLACLRQAQIDAQASWDPQARPAAPEKRPAVAPSKPASKPTKEQPPPPREELPELQMPRAEHVRPPLKNYGMKRESAIPWRIVAVATLSVVLGLVIWSRHLRNTRAETTANTSPAFVPTAQPTAPTASGSAPKGPAASGSSSPASSTPSNAQPPQVTPAAPQPSVQQTTQAASRTSLATQPNPANAAGDTSGENTAEDSNPVPPAKLAAPITVVIRASENSWISVTADGQQVSQETLIAPAHTSIRANHEIVVRAGNAAGVSFLLNGKDVPAQGAESEVKTFVFDAGGMRVVNPPPAQNP